MKKVMILAAILTALCFSSSSSFAYFGPAMSDGQPVPSGAQWTWPLNLNPAPPPLSTPVAPSATSAPPADPTPATDLASREAAQDPDLARKAEELKIAESQLSNAQNSGDQARINMWQPVVIERTETVRERITTVTHKPVTSQDVIPVLRELGLWGPTSKWAKGDVSLAYAKGRLVGYHKGATADEEQGQRPATRQELATVGNRVAREGAIALGQHALSDQQQFMSIWSAIDNSRMWIWIALGIIGALLLLWLLGRLAHRDCQNGGIGVNQPVWANRGVNTQGVNNRNLSAAGETCCLGRN